MNEQEAKPTAEQKTRKVELWTPRRMSRVAIVAALVVAFTFIPIPTMPGITLNPAIPAFAAIYYGPFEAYWGYAVGMLIVLLFQSPGSLVISPFAFLLGYPLLMIVIAWMFRKIKPPWNVVAGIIAGEATHMLSYSIPGCIITYGWEAFPTCFLLQTIGGLIVIGVCVVIAVGGALYMWRINKKPMFPWRFIKPEEKFSIASDKRIMAAAILAVVMAVIPYIFLLTPYSQSSFLGPPGSPMRSYVDAYLRQPMTLGIGWFFWEIYKRHGEWFKQTE